MNKEIAIIPSQEQKDIHAEIVSGKGHLNITATAGSGKSTTLLMGLNLLPKFRKSIFLSFSAEIIKELKEKVPPHVRAQTLHSLGSRYIYQHFGAKPLNKSKYFQKAMFALKKTDEDKKNKKEFLKKCFRVQDIAQYIRITFTELDFDKVELVCADFGIFTCDATVRCAMKLVEEDLNNLTEIDFTDMIYLPVKLPHIINEKFDFVFLDEAQDSNQTQIKFVEYLLKPDIGRLISCGDPKQSIYSFIGADSNSFEYLQTRPNTTTLPLSVSYRCPKAVVEEASKLFPQEEFMRAHHNAVEGVVRNGAISEISENDMVVCRTNKPLFELYFILIENEVKAHFIGKDIEKGLIELAESCLAPIKSRFEQNLENKLIQLEKELKSKGYGKVQNHPKWSMLSEKIELLMLICDKVQMIKDLIPKIQQIFAEDVGGVRLMTGHKAKGLECKRVFCLNVHQGKVLCPSPRASTKREKDAELNIMFVMITRAKEELVYLEL